ncbi:hypothetical protein MLD38_019558 [Melastoma candidum]|uniref:Uncharacterized protein n=1 Tax=Melastoma candidum TaxID=119954 RepID=A0ACB9QWV6_9MYRT|nr:hypothetical protein MLD38_019558 [Melastoma candidum]
MHLFGASSVRGPPMTAPAVATASAASNFLHFPNCYHYYHRHPLPPHRRPSLYHGFNFGFPPARRLDVSVSSLGKSRFAR